MLGLEEVVMQAQENAQKRRERCYRMRFQSNGEDGSDAINVQK